MRCHTHWPIKWKIETNLYVGNGLDGWRIAQQTHTYRWWHKMQFLVAFSWQSSHYNKSDWGRQFNMAWKPWKFIKIAPEKGGIFSSIQNAMKRTLKQGLFCLFLFFLDISRLSHHLLLYIFRLSRFIFIILKPFRHSVVYLNVFDVIIFFSVYSRVFRRRP